MQSKSYLESTGEHRLVIFSDNKSLHIIETDSGSVVSSSTKRSNADNNGYYGEPRVCGSKDGFVVAAAYGDSIYLWNIEKTSGALQLGHRIICDCIINGLALNSDGSRVASIHLGGSLRYWDASTGELLWSRDGHKDADVDISCDDALIVCDCTDNSVGVFDTVSGEMMFNLLGHTDRIGPVLFNPDASRIASASQDMTIRIWDIASRVEVLLLQGFIRAVTGICYSPNGTRLASASMDKSVVIWDAETGVRLFVLLGHTHWVWAVSFSSDGNLLASSAQDQVIIIWDTGSGSELMRIVGQSYKTTNICFLQSLSPLFYLLK